SDSAHRASRRSGGASERRARPRHRERRSFQSDARVSCPPPSSTPFSGSLMNRRQARTLLSLYAVEVFLEAHKDRLPVATSTATRARFGRTLAELELHVRIQAASPIIGEGLTRAKDAKREALLRDHLAPIARIARLEVTRYPALAAVKLPRG